MDLRKIELVLLGLDDLSRAAEHAEEQLKTEPSDFLKSHITGLKLTQRKIEDALGIEAYHAKTGDKFDVNLMHAIASVIDLPDNSVAYQTTAGYKSKENGKIIRFAKVVVNRRPTL